MCAELSAVAWPIAVAARLPAVTLDTPMQSTVGAPLSACASALSPRARFCGGPFSSPPSSASAPSAEPSVPSPIASAALELALVALASALLASSPSPIDDCPLRKQRVQSFLQRQIEN